MSMHETADQLKKDAGREAQHHLPEPAVSSPQFTSGLAAGERRPTKDACLAFNQDEEAAR